MLWSYALLTRCRKFKISTGPFMLIKFIKQSARDLFSTCCKAEVKLSRIKLGTTLSEYYMV